MSFEAFVGQTRSAEMIRELARLGIGECTVTGELPPRRDPWFHDNGAWRNHVAGVPFNEYRWCRDMMRLRIDSDLLADGVKLHALSRRPCDQPIRMMPKMVIVPDMVAGGVASLAMSARFRDEVPIGVPAFLVVQNGMTDGDVAEHLDAYERLGWPYGGIFVGGDDVWKRATGAAWVSFAHARGLSVHVGRCGPPAMVAWARDIGADSIDSSLPIRHEEHLRAFLRALGLW